MLKIKQKNCRFRIDREKQVVVCWVEGDTISNLVEDFLMEHNIDFVGMNTTCGTMRRAEEIVHLPHKVCGVATCFAGDTWNEELGKMIAFNKMKKKLMTLFFKHLQNSVNYMEQVIENMSNAANALGMRFGDELARREAAIESQLNR